MSDDGTLAVTSASFGETFADNPLMTLLHGGIGADVVDVALERKQGFSLGRWRC